MSRARPLLTALLAVVLLATAAAATMIVVSSGVLWAGTSVDETVGSAAPASRAEAPASPVGVAGSLQLSQPRDPFRPLITEDSPIAGIPGVGGVPGTTDPGPTDPDPTDPDPTDPGNGGFTPTGTTITLEEIREVGGALRATVTVNGTSFDVGAGDTFAISYKVVSLSQTKGVFMFGDSAFELSVGQQILK